jgi:hypothetical protein
MVLTGGCVCEKIRYRLTRSPMITQACHCRDCQRITGSAFAINMWIERQYFETLAGKPKSFTRAAGSGKEHQVFFCGTCGTIVWQRYALAPANLLIVRAGTLDKPGAIRPAIHIFTRSKVPWLILPTDALAFKSTYDLEKVWPEARKARLRQCIASQTPALPRGRRAKA